MAELPVVNSVELDGVTIGTDDDPYHLLEIEGWEDAATFDVGSTDRQSDGVHPQRARARDRQVRIRIGLSEDVEDAVSALRGALAPPTDRWARKVFRARTRGVTQRALYMPAAQPLEMAGDERNLVWDHFEATATIWLPDPVKYSDAYTDTTFTVTGGGTDTETVVNAGTYSAVSPGHPDLGAWRLTVTAGSGGCVAPYLAHADFPGERWVLTDSFPPGSVAIVGYDRVTTRGGTLRQGTVRGPGGCPIPIWPVLRPGDNDLTMGCVSGGFTATLRHRSTW